ncbi:tyrosine-type recombinase/integrase [Noviherbaspirillum pedocola]|uniref:Integrase arm-type DNA-binding domain-containing protein n=1 Tax=Noviherbaspirillum pedocola TaxID=2801341 RepID=A0A934SV02_9BURK|nr:integrase arm-type DNA-binding domain-containing protein [Noviherbaspirillum pedocola]MBK4735813.1 integrase arm-type DNA-binding domain-containing protein [Noviherbaspirillum pedocola]
MGRQVRTRLTAVGIKALKQPGYYADGDGLYLQISNSGTKSWIFRFMRNKRAREMGLGSVSTYTLAEARDRVRKCRQLLDEGIDPIEYRQAEREKNLAAASTRRTFAECAHEYHWLHANGWKNRKHADQWINTLTAYAFPVFGTKDVSDVSKADILRVLEPIWAAKPETASRVRQRIRAVLDWAAARDYRHGHDPHLRDQVARSLPKTKDLKKESHFAACRYVEVNAALQSIINSTASSAVKNALEFTILTAARSGEVRGAKWSEIDFEGKRWIIPAERMKAKREHRIPLSPRAMQILEFQRENESELIFANDRKASFSDMTFTALLRRLGHAFTVHGFRSTFRNWAAEQTAFPREVCEAALAHASGKDATEAAYFRSDLFEKRRQLMEAWANYCITK